MSPFRLVAHFLTGDFPVVSHAEQYRTALAVEEGAQCLHAALQLPGDQLVFCPSPFIAGGQFAYVVYIGYIHA